MKLAVFSHKPCWRSTDSPSGFATDGGFAFQMQALAGLFDETRVLVPVRNQAATEGEIPLLGYRLTVVPLTVRSGSGLASKLSFIPWLLRNGAAIVRELRSADAIHAPIPGDVGTVGMLLAWLCRKPLFVRHCGNWLQPVTVAEKFWRWFMETTAGGRNVLLATGGAPTPPSQKNPNVHWIFSSSLTQAELESYASPRTYPLHEPDRSGERNREPSPPEPGGAELPLSPAAQPRPNGPPAQIRLIIVSRQEIAKGAGTVIRSLPQLIKKFPQISFEIIGDGSAIPEFKRLAQELGVAERVHFAGKLNHEQVMERLKKSTLFVFPTTSSDGFPKAVLEALASGLPVVATRVSVLPQLLGTGCGVLIDAATPETVARAVEDALTDSATYESMSRQAIATARKFSLGAWQKEIGEHLRNAWRTKLTKAT